MINEQTSLLSRKPHKTLITRKINPYNEKYISDSLLESYNNPDQYLNVYIGQNNENKIFFDQRIPKNKLHFPRTKSCGTFFLKKKENNKKLSQMNRTNTLSILNFNIRRSSIEKESKVYQEVNNRDLDEIYGYFVKKRNDNHQLRQSNKTHKPPNEEETIKDKFIKDMNYTIDFKTTMDKIFSIQSKTLLNHSKQNISTGLIANRISRIIHKPKHNLLIAKSNFFRCKQEVKNDFSVDLRDNNQLNPMHWPEILRNDVSSTNDHKSNKTKDRKESAMKSSERIYHEKMNNEIEKKKMKAFLKNDYVVNRLTSATLLNVHKNLNDMNDICSIKVEGKDLLDCEIDMTKKMKGRKWIQRIKNKSVDETDSILYEKKQSSLIDIYHSKKHL